MSAGPAMRWDPDQYLRFSDERTRPFFDLLARVAAHDPHRVVDLGCGPGHLTARLADRWPNAVVEGIDSSPEMIERARASSAAPRVSYTLGDLRDWQPSSPVDVLVSSATLQWVPHHLDLLPRWVGHLQRGGWLAIQVPGNFDSPAHRTLFELAKEEPWASHCVVPVTQRPSAPGPDVYLDVLAEAGCDVDAWETTYLHVLDGDDAVFWWMKGTGARPVLAALPDEIRPAFEAAYMERLREAYPRRAYGTVLPYRRVFAVAQRR
ncbi:MAG TPA: trans-aconitate 2-methyltransferase [Actinopolymorphaceae bacterium]|jgi:trans-aconitate 2-methyltransferase